MSELAPVLPIPQARPADADLYTRLRSADLNHAVEIADRVWWVGHLLHNDNFQCHVYLIEQGDQSVLIDVGAVPSFRYVLAKVEEVIPLSQIRWYVCQHPDPDITGALPLIDQLISRPDAAVVTDWRAEALLKHYGLKTPFWRVEDHDLTLNLQDRTLRFVMTPYLHFPGAFVTFDSKTGTLFSSDLFGGFTETPELVAADESYFESMRLFHEHYMPSQDILLHGLSRIEPLAITAIAPQHGSIIPGPLVRPIIERLKTLECGLYLNVESETNIHQLTEMNRVLRDSLRTFSNTRDFSDLICELSRIVQVLLPVNSIDVFACQGPSCIKFAADNGYSGVEATLPQSLVRWRDAHQGHEPAAQHWLPSVGAHGALVIPLRSPDTESIFGMARLRLSAPTRHTEIVERVLERLSTPLSVAVEREVLLREVKNKRQAFYELAIHDPLTGLYNRLYLEESIQRLFEIHDRAGVSSVVISMYDLDDFKKINDTFGHAVGDEVLKVFGKILNENARGGDMAVRIGGEEMLTVHICDAGSNQSCALSERIRTTLQSADFDNHLSGHPVTVSVGVTARRQGESLAEVLVRADRALYRAKAEGRDRIVWEA